MFHVAYRLDCNAIYFGFTTCNIISADYRHSLKINYSNWISLLIKKKLKQPGLTERLGYKPARVLIMLSEHSIYLFIYITQR